MTEMVGIDPVYMRFLAYGIGSALAGISSVLATMDTGIDPNSGIMALLIAVIAVIVGGIGNYSGTALAGLLLGVAENMGIWKIPTYVIWWNFDSALLEVAQRGVRRHGHHLFRRKRQRSSGRTQAQQSLTF
jgi:branched-subunit amino acid ABC-type transport system permease component